MTCAGLVRELEADRVPFEAAFRRFGIGGGGGGGPFEVAAELGTGRRPWAGLSGNPRTDDGAPRLPAGIRSGHSMVEDSIAGERSEGDDASHACWVAGGGGRCEKL